eukprot:4561686-Pleurochrysis_carterae.AAC.1
MRRRAAPLEECLEGLRKALAQAEDLKYTAATVRMRAVHVAPPDLNTASYVVTVVLTKTSTQASISSVRAIPRGRGARSARWRRQGTEPSGLARAQARRRRRAGAAEQGEAAATERGAQR